jgi:hypothetical protein
VKPLNNMSEKEVLKKLSNFPKHELSTEKRMEMMRLIRTQDHVKVKRKFNFQRVTAAAAMLVLMLIAPLLYFTSESNEGAPRTGTTGEVVEKAADGVYFGLIDKNGNPYYADRNFGIPDKVSLLAPNEWIVDDYRSVGKIMIYLWGEAIDYNQPLKELKVEGVHVKTGTKAQLATTVITKSPFGGAEGVTSFQPFTEPGIWNLHFSVGDKVVGEFAIEVKEPYIKIGNATILISKQDLVAGSYENVSIEVEGSDLPSEIELKIKDSASGAETMFTFTDKTDYSLTDGRKLSKYYGSLTVNHSGEFQFDILEQSEKVEVRLP